MQTQRSKFKLLGCQDAFFQFAKSKLHIMRHEREAYVGQFKHRGSGHRREPRYNFAQGG